MDPIDLIIKNYKGTDVQAPIAHGLINVDSENSKFYGLDCGGGDCICLPRCHCGYIRDLPNDTVDFYQTRMLKNIIQNN